MGSKGLTKRCSVAVLTATLLAILALAGCNSTYNSDYEDINQVIYVRTGGDVDMTEVFYLGPDLTLGRQVFKGGFSYSDGNELMAVLGTMFSYLEPLQISEDAWQSIVLEAKRVDFMTLPEELETSEQVSDGSTYYICVEAGGDTHVSGGYAAGIGMDSDDRRFGYLKEYIEIAIDEAIPLED